MKKKSRARIFDFFVLTSLCATFALATFGVKRLLYKDEAVTEKILYTVKIDELDSELCGNISTGEALLSANTKKSLGVIREIEVAPAYREVYSESAGTVVSSNVPGRSRVEITLEADAQRNGGITVGGIRLRVGETVGFRAKNLFFEGEIERVVL